MLPLLRPTATIFAATYWSALVPVIASTAAAGLEGSSRLADLLLGVAGSSLARGMVIVMAVIVADLILGER